MLTSVPIIIRCKKENGAVFFRSHRFLFIIFGLAILRLEIDHRDYSNYRGMTLP